MLPSMGAGTGTDNQDSDRHSGAATERQLVAPRDKASWDLPPPRKQPKTARVHPVTSSQGPHWMSSTGMSLLCTHTHTRTHTYRHARAHTHRAARGRTGCPAQVCRLKAPRTTPYLTTPYLTAAKDRLHYLTRGRTAGDGGPDFSRFDTDVSSPGNVMKTQRWLGNLSPKNSSFLASPPKALQPLMADGSRKSEGKGALQRRVPTVSVPLHGGGEPGASGSVSGSAGAWLAPAGMRVSYASRDFA